MPLQDGESVGPYRIETQLGQGGMATVYKAYHPQLDRYVAIKVLHQSFQADPNFSSRFQREAQIVARLDHPNIVPIFDFSEYKGQPYLVMKFIEGDTLKSVITDRMPPMSAVLDMMSQVASALTYAHGQGVLHRDIKPSNILIDRQDRPYVTDFGLARMVQAGSSTLSQDMLMGTPHYMSPEQARGDQNLGPGTDIYSLGVMLYELAVGRLPFNSTTPYAIVHDHIYTPLPLPSSVNLAISPEVERVLLKALAKEPAERYGSAVEMVTAFKNAVLKQGLQIPAPVLSDMPYGSASRSQTTPPMAIAPVSTQPLTPQKRVSLSPGTTHRPNTWLYVGGGLIALVILAAAVLLLTSHSSVPPVPLPTLASLAATATKPSLNTESTLELTATSAPTTATITLYKVPDLSVVAAQNALYQKPDDPVSYLALAKADWKAGDDTDAENTLADGNKVAPKQQIVYLLTAASIADQLDKSSIAIYLNVAALTLSIKSPNLYSAVRAMSGEYLYNAALKVQPDQTQFDQVRPVGSTSTNTPQPSAPPALVTIMIARGLITENRLTLAEATLRHLSADDADLPEAHLVRGELLQAQGKLSRAKTEWQAIASIQDTPDWVRQRAQQLLGSP